MTADSPGDLELTSITNELKAQRLRVSIRFPEPHKVVRALDSVTIHGPNDVSNLHRERRGHGSIRKEAQDLEAEETPVAQHRSDPDLRNQPRGTSSVSRVPGLLINQVEIFFRVTWHQGDLTTPAAHF